METGRLGRLEHLSTVLIYGGAALSDVPQDVADDSIRFALEAGINHVDTAPAYGGSELHLGGGGCRRSGTGSSSRRRPATGGPTTPTRASCDRSNASGSTAWTCSSSTRSATSRTSVRPPVPGRGRGRRPGQGREPRRRDRHHRPRHAGPRRPPRGAATVPVRHGAHAIQPPARARAAYLRDFDALAGTSARRRARVIKAGARNLWRAGETPATRRGTSRSTSRHTSTRRSPSRSPGPRSPGSRRPVTSGSSRCSSRPSGDAARSGARIDEELWRVPEFEPTFVRVEGREFPDWLGPAAGVVTGRTGGVTAGWWEGRPWRLIQTNLREIDMRDIDAARYVEELRAFDATVAMINTSGIIASYPTRLGSILPARSCRGTASRRSSRRATRRTSA